MHVVDATVFYSPTSGGVRRYMLAKHEWMRAHTDWRHSLVVPGETNTHAPGGISMVRGTRVPGVLNYRLPLNPLSWIRAIEALEPDLIEVGDAFQAAWAASRVARRRDVPVVAFYHSNLPQLVGRRLGTSVRRIIESYVRHTYEPCALVLAPSRDTCDYLRSFGVGNVTSQPLGVDIDTFNPVRRRRDLREELGLARGTRLLAFAGRFSAEKNIDVLTEALRKLGDRYHLLMVGGDETRRDGNVTRIPYRRDNRQLATYFASADALLHAGTYETFGLVVLEAMACGRPVVAMRAGALPELIAENTGLLAEPQGHPVMAAVSLAAAVEELYARDPDAMGEAARRHVEANYSWTHVLPGLMSRYQVAVSARGRVAAAGAP
ncbi:glycosyltransferase [Tessaracoccus sp. G1721]